MRRNTTQINVRVLATEVLTRVLKEQLFLDISLNRVLSRMTDPRERSLIQELCYGVLRWLPRLQRVLAQLLEKPVRRRDLDVNCLLLLGLYQLEHTRIPDHAAVTETVAATRILGKPWASALVNATLRRYLNQHIQIHEAIKDQEEAEFSHSSWLIRAIREAWPEDWEFVLAQNNARAPLTLRVNARACTRDAYLEKLSNAGLAAAAAPHTTHGVTLAQSVAVERLPGFEQGLVSVQDASAQMAAGLLKPRKGHRILDACAAPGGKCAQILETTPDIGELVAIEKTLPRAKLLRQTLSRLSLSATLITTDARDTATWWNGTAFDRILLDVPCSATGVIRRHPDIKLLRQEEDIHRLVETQAQLLESLWGVLVSGGRLVYATCSIFPAENQHQINRFLHQHTDAHEVPIVTPWGKDIRPGRQILPGVDAMDGFYYAVVQKH